MEKKNSGSRQITIRFPVTLISEIEEEIAGTYVPFSTFVKESVRKSLQNLKEQEEQKPPGAGNRR